MRRNLEGIEQHGFSTYHRLATTRQATEQRRAGTAGEEQKEQKGVEITHTHISVSVQVQPTQYPEPVTPYYRSISVSAVAVAVADADAYQTQNRTQTPLNRTGAWQTRTQNTPDRTVDGAWQTEPRPLFVEPSAVLRIHHFEDSTGIPQEEVKSLDINLLPLPFIPNHHHFSRLKPSSRDRAEFKAELGRNCSGPYPVPVLDTYRS
jgi:hypothetical protein